MLIDAGCEIDCYASDITRTFPVSGKFSPEQKAIYELVLAAQEAAFNEIAPGKHWNEAHEATVRVITAGLVELGLLEGAVDELIAAEAYKPFYMHRAGHWLGMDVHDVGDYKVGGEWRVLEPGMAMTVEPGIYIAVDNAEVASDWRGIGVRIEDDVVVTSRRLRDPHRRRAEDGGRDRGADGCRAQPGGLSCDEHACSWRSSAAAWSARAWPWPLQAGARARGWRILLVEPFAPGTDYQPSYDARPARCRRAAG